MAIRGLRWEILTQNNQQIIQLIGELTARSVLSLWENRHRLIETEQQLIFDLAQIQGIDSAGIALLCDLLKLAQQQGNQPLIQHIPEDIRALAALYNLQSWLEQFEGSY